MKNEKKKLSLIVFSGEFDSAIAAFTLASGAAATGYEVNMFFTFWGLNLLKNKQGRAFIGTGILAKIFGFLMGGRKNLPLTRFNFAGLSPRLMTMMMKKANVATLPELIDATMKLGVKLYPCEMSMNIFGITKDNYIPEAEDVLGVASFLEISKGGQTLFI